VASGTVVSQVIVATASLALTRLYSPEQMGAYTAWGAVAAMIGVVAAGRYDLAIVLPEEDRDATALAALGVFIAFTLGTVLVVFFSFAGHPMLRVLGLQDVPRIWAQFIGVLVFLAGVNAVLTRLVIRDAKFRPLATTQVVQQASSSGLMIASGLLRMGTGGLFLSSLLGSTLRNIQLMWHERHRRSHHVAVVKIKSLARRYKHYPLLSTWGAFLNTASTQLPIVMLGSLYSSTAVGHYSLGYRVLALPVSLVGQSVTTVFIERAASVRSRPPELKRLVVGLYRSLLLVGASVLPVITFYGDIIVPWLFGKEWLEAGRYAQWMSLWLIMLLASSPLTTIFTILERQGVSLFVNLLIFSSRAAAIAISAAVGATAYQMIVIFALTGVLVYSCVCVAVLRMVKATVREMFRASWLALMIVAAHGLIAAVVRIVIA
jgi:O-antigen/teichoic acid export membrane protein